MNLPKWLVIVGIVIIVLGVLSCGIGVGRALTESTPSPNTSPNRSVDVIPVGVVSLTDVRPRNCAAPTPGPTASAQTFSSPPCVLAVDPIALRPRDLLLTTSGTGVLTVRQAIRGATSSPRSTFAPGRTFNVRVSGTTTVEVEITTCSIAPCLLTVRER